MDLTVEEYIDQLLTDEAFEKPSDTVKPEELTVELPEWFDEKQFNKARRFYWDNCFAFSSTMLLGLVATLSVPSILKVLIHTYRSTTPYTAYKRYIATFLHTVSWFEEELKPGSRSWRSLFAVRKHHLQAGLASKMKGIGVVSQRDLALTQFGFIGFSILKPDKIGIRQFRAGDWEAYNHFWKVIGYMIGLEDRYNLCRKTIEQTRLACKIVQERVYTPCLENVPEYYEHMARVLLEGMVPSVPLLNVENAMFYCKYLADVPGYIYKEEDRIKMQRSILKQLKGKPYDTGVESSALMSACAVKGLPELPPRLHYLSDYETLDASPPYSKLSPYARFKMNYTLTLQNFYDTTVGRMLLNMSFTFNYLSMRYFPYGAFLLFGFKNSFVDIFQVSPTDYTKPKTNAECYEADKNRVNLPWYLWWIPNPVINFFHMIFK